MEQRQTPQSRLHLPRSKNSQPTLNLRRTRQRHSVKIEAAYEPGGFYLLTGHAGSGKTYPHKIKINVKGLEIDRTVSLDALLGKKNLEEVLEDFIENRIVSISYANPKTYLQFVGKVAGIDIEDRAFEDYLEIKATRDLLIHNSGVANAIYLTKAGPRGRAAIGEEIIVDKRYFDHCVATIKRISGIVSRDISKVFPDGRHPDLFEAEENMTMGLAEGSDARPTEQSFVIG